MGGMRGGYRGLQEFVRAQLAALHPGTPVGGTPASLLWRDEGDSNTHARADL